MNITIRNGDVVGGVRRALLNQAYSYGKIKELLHTQLVRKKRAVFGAVLDDPLIRSTFGSAVVPLQFYNIKSSSTRPYHRDYANDLGLNQLFMGQNPYKPYVGNPKDGIYHDTCMIMPKSKKLSSADGSCTTVRTFDVVLTFRDADMVSYSIDRVVLTRGRVTHDAQGVGHYPEPTYVENQFYYRFAIDIATAQDGEYTVYSWTDRVTGEVFSVRRKTALSAAEAHVTGTSVEIVPTDDAFAVYGSYVGDVGEYHIFDKGFAIKQRNFFATTYGRESSRFRARSGVVQLMVYVYPLYRDDPLRSPILESNRDFVLHWDEYFELFVEEDEEWWSFWIEPVLILAAIVATVYTLGSDGGSSIAAANAIIATTFDVMVAVGISQAIIDAVIVVMANVLYSSVALAAYSALDIAATVMNLVSLVQSVGGVPSPSAILAAADPVVRNQVMAVSSMTSPFDYDGYLDFDRLVSV